MTATNSVQTTPVTQYLTTDTLGSPRVITDQAGNVHSRRDFMPFGEDLMTVGGRSVATGYKPDNARQKFTGYQKDNETGLDFAEARMYNNNHGRFTAVDPLISSGRSADPQTFNRYIYTSNNPITRIDRNGLDWYIAFDRNGQGGYTMRPAWCEGQFKCGHYDYRWGSQGSFRENRRTYTFDARSFAFYDLSTRSFAAYDFYENRNAFFGTMAEAQSQITAWNKQAALNFMGGALDAASLAYSVADGSGRLGVETNSQMYAMGKRAGYGGMIASLITGVGLGNALVGTFGKGALAAAKEINIISKTGTVWDSIKATQAFHKGSFIPQSFELATSNGKFWVHGNATEHIAQFAKFKAGNYAPEAVRMASQAQLTSFHAAVEAASQNGIVYNQLIEVGGWELKFSQARKAGDLPVISHARQIH